MRSKTVTRRDKEARSVFHRPETLHCSLPMFFSECESAAALVLEEGRGRKRQEASILVRGLRGPGRKLEQAEVCEHLS